MRSIISLLCILTCTARGADFVNLGFEEAHVSAVGVNQGPTADLVPGWQLFSGINPVPVMWLNSCPYLAGEPFATLVGTEAIDCGVGPAEGNYAFFLAQINRGSILQLTQVADIPVGARLLTYKFYLQGLKIFINGEELSRTNLPAGGSAPALGYPGIADFDISGFAGQTAELALVAPLDGNSMGYVDSIAFVLPLPVSQPQAVPDVGFHLMVTEATVGKSVEIQASTDLSIWFSVGKATASSNTVEFIDSGATNSTHRFYRAREILN